MTRLSNPGTRQEKKKCACPSMFSVDCAEYRYGVHPHTAFPGDYERPLPCDCVCHDWEMDDGGDDFDGEIPA